VPTLIFHGDDDQIVPISTAVLCSLKLVKNATFAADCFHPKIALENTVLSGYSVLLLKFKGTIWEVQMSRQYNASVFLLALVLCVCSMALCQESSTSAVADYGRAVVEKALRVDSQCRVFCDIQDWPAIIGKEMPIQIRGLDPKQSFSLPTRQFILETLTAASSQNPAPTEPNQPARPKVLLEHIQRGEAFCLVADVKVDGQDLGQMLVDKGYAKKLIVPKTAAGASTNLSAVQPSTAADNSNASSPVAEGFVASKTGKVFHKPTCPHVRRIQGNMKVTYQTREEAIAAGRRPCQTCNP
jgi:hypothetical protein